jgi:TonB family protein
MRYLPFALFLFASTANAENWQQIGNPDPNRSILMFDAAGVSEVKGLRRAWFKTVYDSDQPIPQEFLASVPKDLRSYRFEKTLRYFNCTARTSAVMRYFWNGADEKAGGYFYQDLLVFRDAPRGSRDEQMLDAACNFTGELANAEAAKLQLPGAVHARMVRPVSPADYYPSGSRRRGEKGSPIVMACVDSTSKLMREPVVTSTSGFPDLDRAAVKVAKATRYAAGIENGEAAPESCITFKINFGL